MESWPSQHCRSRAKRNKNPLAQWDSKLTFTRFICEFPCKCCAPRQHSYALFGDDIRLQVAPVSSDGFFNMLTALALTLFIIEIIIFSLVQPDYFHLPNVGAYCANIIPSEENSLWNVMQK